MIGEFRGLLAVISIRFVAPICIDYYDEIID